MMLQSVVLLSASPKCPANTINLQQIMLLAASSLISHQSSVKTLASLTAFDLGLDLGGDKGHFVLAEMLLAFAFVTSALVMELPTPVLAAAPSPSLDNPAIAAGVVKVAVVVLQAGEGDGADAVLPPAGATSPRAT